MSTHVYNMHEAKTQLSRLVEQVLEGEDVVIARNGKRLVRLIKDEPVRPRRVFGSLKGKVTIDDDELIGPDPDIQALFDESIERPLL
ncbi:MAG TPA: type II toxin-antitoxin system prevent-host-death family antitoxin [Ilumatobacter sp.]|nr:type II toxin-antitoxin system prevent-host-death family antitoxin [Ilumatobacter sp.]